MSIFHTWLTPEMNHYKCGTEYLYISSQSGILAVRYLFFFLLGTFFCALLIAKFLLGASSGQVKRDS